MRYFTAIFSLFSLTATAAEQVCYAPQPVAKKNLGQPSELQSINSESLVILSDSTEVGVNQPARFTGRVSILNGNNRITADSAQISAQRDSLTAQGGIEFITPNVTVKSDSLDADIEQKVLQLNDSNYQLDNFLGHGQANVFRIDQNNRQVELEDASFTNCPPQNRPDWQIKSNEIRLDIDDEWGQAWHSRIEVFEVPVLYLPYISFPLSDKRKSGLLYPSISTSTQRGLDVQIPYYWNIAENMDYTLTSRLMTDRGAQFGNEFRYLSDTYEGELFVEWMPHDRQYATQETLDSGQRSAMTWIHNNQFANGWEFAADLTFVSDDSYVSDLEFRDINSVDTYVERTLNLEKITRDWTLEFSMRDFEVFGQHLKPYRTLPEIRYWYGGLSNSSGWSFELPMEFAWFQARDVSLPEAVRTHIEPELSWSVYQPAWEFRAETSLPATYYWQEKMQDDLVLHGDYEEISRVMPRFRVNSRLIFERPLDWFGRAMRQTLEPRAQYLYVPYREQSAIGLYDTALLQDDYLGLFRENRFSGLDRIPESNQVTLGVTTRLLNDENREKLRFSVGQILFLNESRTDFVDYNESTEKGESALAAELDFDIRKTWFLHYGLQYDTENEETRKSQLTLDYYADDSHMFQLGHRYVRDVSGSQIQQVNLTSLWQLDEQWRGYASYHYDLELDRTVESRIGLLYESCCWQLTFGWQTKIKSNLSSDDSQSSTVTEERDSGMLLSFTIRGFGASSTQSAKILNGGIFGYRKPYFLNQ